MKKIFLFVIVVLAAVACEDSKYNLKKINDDVVLFQDSLVLPIGTSEQIVLGIYINDEFITLQDLVGLTIPELPFDPTLPLSSLTTVDLDLSDVASNFFAREDNALEFSCRLENSMPFAVKLDVNALDDNRNPIPNVSITGGSSLTFAGAQSGSGSSFTDFKLTLKGTRESVEAVRHIGFDYTMRVDTQVPANPKTYVKMTMWAKLIGGVTID